MNDETHNAHETPVEDEELQTALEEVLGDEPRATELRQMSKTLRLRRTALMRDMDTAEGPERETLREAIAALDEKIEILEEEAGITKFIEDTVRFTIEVQRLEQN